MRKKPNKKKKERKNGIRYCIIYLFAHISNGFNVAVAFFLLFVVDVCFGV